MTNWSEKVSGDAEANAAARENLMRPIEIPVLGTIGIGVLVLAVSRVLLASSVNGAVVVATVAGLLVFGGAMAISKRPEMPRRAIRSISPSPMIINDTPMRKAAICESIPVQVRPMPSKTKGQPWGKIIRYARQSWRH